MERIVTAAKMAGAHDFIVELPEGLRHTIMKAKILVFLFLAIISCQSSAGSLTTHKDFLKLLSPKIHSAFIRHGVCADSADSNDCQELYFFETGTETLYLSFYSVKDFKVIQDVINNILSVYEENNSSPSIELSIYKADHSEGLKRIFNRDRPILTMLIEEKI